jgi:uncharacterized protein YkwD
MTKEEVMHKIKKALSILATVSLIAGMGTAARSEAAPVPGFNDLDPDSTYKVQALAERGVVSGYPDGTFRPANPVSRAEFAAMLCRAMGLEEEANAKIGATGFSDVPAGNWASGYVNLAVEAGIVNGMGDGTFRPAGNVSYNEEIKMIVCALGLGDKAMAGGGWPDGYLTEAKGISLISDAASSDRPLNRGETAGYIYDSGIAPAPGEAESRTYGSGTTPASAASVTQQPGEQQPGEQQPDDEAGNDYAEIQDAAEVPGSSTPPVVSVTDTDAAPQIFFDLTNNEREQAGLPLLQYSPELSQAAAIRVEEVATKFDHTRPNGQGFYSVLEEVGTVNRFHMTGENIASRYASTESAIAGLMASPEHKANILGEYTHMGVAVTVTNGILYHVQMFGSL